MKARAVFSSFLAGTLALLGSCSQPQASRGEQPSVAVAGSMELVYQVRRTSRLYTAEYQVHKIVTHEDVKHLRTTLLGKEYDTPLSLGDRKVAIPIDVTLCAYIDFSTFHESQLERSPDGTKLHITLPDPKVVVTSSRVDHEATRQFTDLLRSDYTDQELADFTEQGVKSILRQVPEMGVLETARENAAAILIPMLASLGYAEEDVVVTFRKEFTGQDLPFYYDEKGKKPLTPHSPRQGGTS